jgi:hypothetical protein
LDLAGLFAAIELLLGLAMTVFGAWQYIIGGPLPGALGRPVRPNRELEDLPPVRWQVSGGAQALFGVGFLMFGAALLLQGRVGLGAVDALRVLGLGAWAIAAVLLVLLLTRYRRRG